MRQKELIINQVQNIALCIFFFSINFEVWDPFDTGGLFSVSKLTGLIYFGSRLASDGQFIISCGLKYFITPIWIYFVLLTLVSFWNINEVSSSFIDFSLFQNIVLFWLLLSHDRKKPGVLGKGMLSYAFGALVLSLCFYAGIGIEYVGGRVTLFGDNANVIAMHMSISTAIFILAVVQNQFHLSGLRFMLLAPIPIMLKLMAETGSRVAFISFASMFITGGVLLKAQKTFHKIIILALVLGAFFCTMLYILQSDILMTRLTMISEIGDLAGREVIWEELVPLIRDNPICGVGKTGYVQFTNRVFYESDSPHNVVIEVLCYTGIIGLIVYLSFIWRIAKRAFVAYETSGMLLPLLLLIPIAGLILSGQLLTVKVGWIIFAYVVSTDYCSLRYPSNLR